MENLFAASAKPFQAPEYCLESRKTKQPSSDDFDPFAALNAHSKSRQRTLSTRSSAFGRAQSASTLSFAAHRPPLATHVAAFSIHQDESPEEALEEIIGNCVFCASGKIEFSNRSLKEIPASIGDLANIVALDKFVTTFGSTPNLLSSMHTGSVPLQLFLANNQLTPSSFPLSFFSLTNLTVLSLRGNPLKELPPSIGQLRALKELYLGANEGLKWLPAELQQLELHTLTLLPNNLMQPSALKAEEHPISKRLLAPLTRNGKLPSLLESCYRRLLCKPTSASHRMLSQVSHHVHSLPVHLRKPLLSASAPSDTSAVFDPNGNVCVCSRQHKAFVQPMEERFEWVETVAGIGLGRPGVPIRWRGCSLGCLSFLEEKP